MKRLSNLDYVRLFLALEVVGIHTLNFKHAGWVHPDPFIPPVPPVPAFVALSGYLIPGSFATSTGWKHFAWKRVLRVYPAFFVSLLLTWALLGIGAVGNSFVAYFTAGIVMIGVANWPLWSLMVEEVAYASHVVARLTKLWAPWWPASIAAALLVISGLLTRAQILHFGPSEAIDLFPALISYCLGNLLYLYREKLEKIPWWAIAGAALAVAAVWRYPAMTTYTPMFYPVPAVLAVWAALRFPWQLPRIPDISYGVYIYHVPVVLWLMSQHVANLLPPTLMIVMPLAAISWFGLESRALRLKNRPPRGWVAQPEAEPIIAPS